jgi:sarcosine oxidase delta subunit
MSCQIEVDGASMTEKIKPCPVCGARAEHSFYYLKCSNRDCAMSHKWQKQERWNDFRPVEESLRAQMDKMIEAISGRGCPESFDLDRLFSCAESGFVGCENDPKQASECWRKFLAAPEGEK